MVSSRNQAEVAQRVMDFGLFASFSEGFNLSEDEIFVKLLDLIL